MAEKKDSHTKAHAPVAPTASAVEKPAEVTQVVPTAQVAGDTTVPDMFAPEPPATATTVTGINHEKSYVKTLIFSAMFGYFGVDRFYLGKIGTGVLKIVTLGGLGIWVLVDFIITLVGGAREKGKETLELEDTGKYKPFFIRLTLVWVGIYIALIVLELLLIFIWMPKLMKELTPAQDRYELVCYDHWNQNYLPPETCPDYMPSDHLSPATTNIYREN